MAIEITSESLAGTQPEATAAYKDSQPAPFSGFSTASKRSSRRRFRLAHSRWTRRNFSSRAREPSGGDAISLSVPKSGRTWLGACLCAYFCKRFGLELALRAAGYGEQRIPRLCLS